MNKEIEEKIINGFFVDRKVERAKYALNSKNKRQDFIWRFSNLGIFNEDCMKKIEKPIPSYKTILEILNEKDVPRECYVISCDESVDGKTMALEYALREVVGLGPAVISCIHGKLAYLECEQGRGAPMRYLLVKN